MGRNTWLFLIIAGILVLLGIFGVLHFYSHSDATPSLKPKSFTTETIGKGSVFASVNGYGTVESEKDILLLSPERSIIKNVYKTPGNKVEKGDLIMELDEESVLKEIERMNDQLEMRRNALKKQQLNFESTKLELARNEEVKKMRIASLKSSLAEQEKMLTAGSTTQSRIDRTKQEIELAENDLETLKGKNEIRMQQLAADQSNLELQIKTQEDNVREKKSMLPRLKVTAPVPGVILEISGEKGARIEDQRMLVRMSDLSSFKIVGMIESKYAYLIKTGNRVIVKADGADLEGQLGKTIPIMDERIQFEVYLKDNSSPKLIPDQNLPLEIISSEQENVMRMKKQAGFENATRQELYVIRENEAVRTEVIFGTVGAEWCEIVSGLNEGDVILTSGPDPLTGPARIDLK